MIVNHDPGSIGLSALREWLRNDRRLGAWHWCLIPEAAEAAAGSAAAAPAVAAPAPATPAAVAPEAPPASSPAAAASARPAATASLFAAAPDLPPLCDRELSQAEAAAALADLDARLVKPCTRCRLHAQRRQTVFGVGAPRAELVFVGEGPGAEEDAQGLPFVGRAGQLLTRMIAAMTLTREQVYICNVVKCRPPGNRTPADDEMETCCPYLFRQLAIIRPKVIVALGRPATQTLLMTKTAIGKLRGQMHDFPPPALAHVGLPPARLMPTFHPAYLLRNPAEKHAAWADLQVVMKFLGLRAPGRG